MRIFFCVLILAVIPGLSVFGQDAFYTQVLQDLNKEYGISGGELLLGSTENEVSSNFFFWGNASLQVVDIDGQAFSKVVQGRSNSAGNNIWDNAIAINNPRTINLGDVLLAIFWIRSTEAQNGTGTANIFFEENNDPFDKDFEIRPALGSEWQQFLIPFKASRRYAANEGKFGLHLAFQSQTVQIGGVTIINYGSAYTLDQLPSKLNLEDYEGSDPNAPWRTAAANRIDQFRKANLKIKVTDVEGNPIPNARIKVSMQKHDYAFGSAIVTCRIAGNNCQNNIYQQKLLDLDGKGHGFNWVVTENALKWRAWEGSWPTDKSGTARAIQWLVDHGIKVRGHNLLWPGWQYLPDDLENASFSYVQNRLNDRLDEVLQYPGVKGNIAEWDVLNEITFNRDLENLYRGQPGYPTGRELYAEVFKKAADLNPRAKMYINDFVTISLGGLATGTTQQYKNFIQEIIDDGVPIDGIGFQAHISNTPVPPTTVYNVFEDFAASFDAKFKVTEFDMIGMEESLEGQYIRDFLTITFSHPQTDGFLMWGFWDGNHWKNNAPIYRQDWSLKPSGQAFLDLVYQEWWTDEELITDANGEVSTRAFKGQYEIEVSCNDATVTETLDLTNNESLTFVNCEALNAESLFLEEGLKAYPNPSQDQLWIEQYSADHLKIELFSIHGRKLMESLSSNSITQLDLSNLKPGAYLLQVTKNDRRYFKRILKL